MWVMMIFCFILSVISIIAHISLKIPEYLKDIKNDNFQLEIENFIGFLILYSQFIPVFGYSLLDIIYIITKFKFSTKK